MITVSQRKDIYQRGTYLLAGTFQTTGRSCCVAPRRTESLFMTDRRRDDHGSRSSGTVEPRGSRPVTKPLIVHFSSEKNPGVQLKGPAPPYTHHSGT
ncbi:unnamed protein product [Arctogadus glacialis]